MNEAKNCEFCKKEFIPQKISTRFCCHLCAQKAYKERIKTGAIQSIIVETNKVRLLNNTDLELEYIKQKVFLSIKDARIILGISKSTLYRLLKSKTIKSIKLGRRTIIRRKDIDSLFNK